MSEDKPKREAGLWRDRLLLAAIMLLAAVLTAPGFFAPSGTASPWVVSNVLHYFRDRTLHSEFFGYPLAQGNLFGLVSAVGLLGGRALGIWSTPQAYAFLADSRRFMVVAEGLSLVCALGAILVTYHLGRRLGDRKTGLLAALFLALTPVFNRYAHEGVPDAAMTFAAALAILALVALLERPTRREYVLAGAALGLATAVKYNAGLWVVAALGVHVWTWRQRRAPLRALLNADLIYAGLAGAAVFALTSFQVLVEPRTFLSHVLHYETDYKLLAYSGGVSAATFRPWLSAVGVFLRSEYGIAWLFLGGMAWALVRRTPARWLLLLGVLLAWAYMGRWRMIHMRFYFFVYPALAALAAVAIVEATAWLRARRGWLAPLPGVICAGLLAWTAITYGADSYRLLMPDTRVISRVWIEQNLPSGAILAGANSPEGYPALLDREPVDKYLAGRAIPARWKPQVAAIVAQWPSYDLRSLYAHTPQPEFPADWPAAIRAQYQRNLWARNTSRSYASMERVRALKAQYLVTSSFWSKDFLEHASAREIQPYDAREAHFQSFREFYQRLQKLAPGGPGAEGIRCLTEFTPTTGQSVGPQVRVYRLESEDQPSPSQSPPS